MEVELRHEKVTGFEDWERPVTTVQNRTSTANQGDALWNHSGQLPAFHPIGVE